MIITLLKCLDLDSRFYTLDSILNTRVEFVLVSGLAWMNEDKKNSELSSKRIISYLMEWERESIPGFFNVWELFEFLIELAKRKVFIAA